jgi:hypothetical protein
MTYAQLVLLLRAQRRDDEDEQRRWPDRYWRDWRDKALERMRQHGA